MKVKFLNTLKLSILIVPLFFASCHADFIPGITGEGEVVSRTVMLDDFSGFGNAISADIYVSQGDEQEVVIEAQENIIDNLDLSRVSNGFWSIRYDRWVRRAKQVKIYITVPDLDRVVISGSGNIFGESNFEDLGDLELKISGSGNMELDIVSESLDMLVSGSGNFYLTGVTRELYGRISGSGEIDAFDLETEHAEFTISGAGTGRFTVSDYLKATISGSGSVYYRGNPETDVHISGSGDVYKDQ